MSQARLIGGIIVIVASLFVIIGSVMPWAAVSSVFGNTSKGGMEGDGKITIFLGFIGLIGGILLLTYEKTWWGAGVTIMASLGAFAVGLIDLIDVLEKSAGLSTDYVKASPGIGLYLTTIGAAIGFIFACVAASKVKAVTSENGFICPSCEQPVQRNGAFCRACGYRMRVEREE